MFRVVSNPIARSRCIRFENWSNTSSQAHRRLSLISIHASFPASLLRLSLGRGVSLFNHEMNSDGKHMPYDGVVVSQDGAVYPAVLASPRGILRHPNLIQSWLNLLGQYLTASSSCRTPLRCKRSFDDTWTTTRRT